MTYRKTLPLLLVALAFACAEDDVEPTPARDAGTRDAGSSDAGHEDAGTTDAGFPPPPVELTTDLCDDPSKLALLVDSLGGEGEGPSYGAVNPAQFQRMAMAPTEGPFYMVNLIRFRERAQYPDGRATDLTGREANGLYAPTEFLTAIGARPVFVADVERTTLGESGAWDQVAIVEYPCPLALFAMSAHPEFQARSIHKDAGLEKSIVMVTHLQPLGDVETSTSPFPATPQDPAFEHVQVFRLANDGRDALDTYTSSVSETEQRLGFHPVARLAVQGVFIGDERTWDEVWIDFVPSGAAYDARNADPAVVAAEPLRDAAYDEVYGLATASTFSSFPGAPAGPGLPPVTADGTGTPCRTDADCPGNGVEKCLVASGDGGFCTREGCGASECQAPYLCCRECNPAIASMLPFEGSACLPESAVTQLESAPISCTCD